MGDFDGKLRAVLSKFSLLEIKQFLDVTEDFMGQVSWTHVRDTIREKRLKSDIKTVVSLILQKVKNAPLEKTDQRKILTLLDLNDAAYHKNRKWQCIRFENQVEPVTRSAVKLNENIISCYRREARDAEVLYIEEDHGFEDENYNLIWLMVSEKKISKRGVYFLKPITFVVNFALPRHAFYSASNPSESSLQLFGRALGYESYDEVTLTSRDVRGMFGMLERNEAHVVNHPPDFDAGEPIFEDGVVDFTQGRQREAYALRVFSDETNISEFTARANCEFKGSNIIPGIRGTMAATSLTFEVQSGRGVEEIFKQMIQDNTLQLPLPHYICNFHNIPTTSVELKRRDE